MLHRKSVSHCLCIQPFFRQSPSGNAPDLQSPSAEHTRALVLGQVRGGRALVIGHLLLARLFHHLARVSGIGVARDNHILAVDGRLVGIGSFGALVALEPLVIDEILRLILLKDLLLRLVVVAA